MSNLQPNWCLKIDFQKVDQHAGGKWLIHDTKRRKDNQLQSLKLPAEYPSWAARCDIKGSDGTMLNPIFWKKVQGQKHPGRWVIVEHQIPSIKVLLKTNAKSHILDKYAAEYAKQVYCNSTRIFATCIHPTRATIYDDDMKME